MVVLLVNSIVERFGIKWLCLILSNILKCTWIGLFNLLIEGVCNKHGRQCAYKRNTEARVVTIVAVNIKTYHIF
jgi:hypothetical protein